MKKEIYFDLNQAALNNEDQPVSIIFQLYLKKKQTGKNTTLLYACAVLMMLFCVVIGGIATSVAVLHTALQRRWQNVSEPTEIEQVRYRLIA